MNCCPRCFAHGWVKQLVKETSSLKGTCDYCESKNVPIVDVATLCGPFSNLVGMYSPLESGVNVVLFKEDSPLSFGSSLIDLVQEDWNVFSERLVILDRADKLIEDIVNSDWDDDSGEDPVRAHELYTRDSSLWHDSLHEKWTQFRAKVRKDPSLEPDFHELFGEDIVRVETCLKEGTILYRARSGHGVDEDQLPTAHQGCDIAAPPAEKTLASRAGPKGKRVLYCTSDQRTAIAEIRPQRGLLVSLAKMQVTRDVRLLDLCSPLPLLNPFKQESLRYELELREVLADFSDELATPLRRTDEPKDYLATQKIAALVEGAGYDGIIYKSAMAPSGRNLVFFDPDAAQPIESELIEVIWITIRHKPYVQEE